MHIKNIYWICDSPSPYNSFLFCEINRNKRFSLEVSYSHINKDYSIWDFKTDYKWREIKSRFFDFYLFRKTFSRDNIFIIGSWNKLFCYFIFLFAKKRYIVWTDTPRDVKVKHSLFEITRKGILFIVLKYSLAIFGTGEPAVKRLSLLARNKKLIYNFPCWIEIPERPVIPIVENKIVILAVGRLVSIKSYEQLIALANKLLEDVITNFHIDLIGDGPEYEKLTKEIEKFKLQKFITLKGKQTNEEVLKAIRESHIFVHTAKWEPYGVVVLEAMAYGKVVVASDRTMAAIDRIKDGKNGFLYKTGNNNHLKELIKNIILNQEILNEIGIEAHRTASEWKIDLAHNILENAIGKYLL